MYRESFVPINNDNDSPAENTENTSNENENENQPENTTDTNENPSLANNSLARSNREAYARGLNHNYKDQIENNKKRLEEARNRAANPYKMKKGHEDEEMKADENDDSKKNFEDKNKLDKLKDKAGVLGAQADLVKSKINDAKSKAFMATHPVEAAEMALANKVKKIIIAALISILPILLIIFVVVIVVLFLLGVIDNGEQDISGLASNNGECGFTISSTSLSKTEFIDKLKEYTKQHSHWQVFVDNANDYYDYARAKGVNPELVVLIAYKEGGGHLTAGANNYWGLACPNGATSCGGYGSFMEAAKYLIDLASKWGSLMDWFDKGHYSYIGDYWYNPGSSGLGGCYYAPYIYKENMPDRVKNACASGKTCSNNKCVKTTKEDQTAYAKYLVYDVMGSARKTIFGLDKDDGVSCETIVASSEFVEKYVQWMIAIAKDDRIGYSQGRRQLNPDVDCSSFVYYGLTKGAGISPKKLGGTYPFTTYTMDTLLTRNGFKAHKYKTSELQRGDILWRAEHTEVYVGNGKNVGAHSNKDGRNGDGAGNEVNVQKNWGIWTRYYRYEP